MQIEESEKGGWIGASGRECRRSILIYGHVLRETLPRASSLLALPLQRLDYNQPFYPRLSMSLISIITQTLKSQYPPRRQKGVTST